MINTRLYWHSRIAKVSGRLLSQNRARVTSTTMGLCWRIWLRMKSVDYTIRWMPAKRINRIVECMSTKQRDTCSVLRSYLFQINPFSLFQPNLLNFSFKIIDHPADKSKFTSNFLSHDIVIVLLALRCYIGFQNKRFFRFENDVPATHSISETESMK